jgi:hypothetical protein
MKQKLSTIGVIICCMAILASCDNENQIIPVYEESQSAEKILEGSESARKKSDHPNSLTTAVTGNIDGRNFTGNFTVTEFIEDAGEIYAQGYLTDAKIKGKDHKYLEYVLEKATYSIPVTIHGVAQSGATSRIAQTCSILDLSFSVISADVLGLAVEIDLIDITIDANDNETLGNLICTGLDTIDNVVGLVELLNQILDLLSL